MTSFKTPTADQVSEAVRRIPTPQLRGAFFAGLKNPLWLEPLAAAGMFSNPPEPQLTGDGSIRDIYWPEIDYLKRVAPGAPNLVVDILLRLEASHNPWVRRAVFSIGAAVPADQAARLKPLWKSWLDTGFGWRSDPREMVAVAINLFEGGQSEVGHWLANVLFEPSEERTRNNASPVLEDYWYADGLPRVAAQQFGPSGLRGCTSVAGRVRAAERAPHRHDGLDANVAGSRSAPEPQA